MVTPPHQEQKTIPVTLTKVGRRLGVLTLGGVGKMSIRTNGHLAGFSRIQGEYSK